MVGCGCHALVAAREACAVHAEGLHPQAWAVASLTHDSSGAHELQVPGGLGGRRGSGGGGSCRQQQREQGGERGGRSRKAAPGRHVWSVDGLQRSAAALRSERTVEVGGARCGARCDAAAGIFGDAGGKHRKRAMQALAAVGSPCAAPALRCHWAASCRAMRKRMRNRDQKNDCGR